MRNHGHPAFLRALRTSGDILSALRSDYDVQLKSIKRLSSPESVSSGKVALDELLFWIRGTVRTFCATCEAVSWQLRRAIVEHDRSTTQSLTNKKVAELLEIHPSDSQRVVPNSIVKNVSLAFRLLPEQLNSSWQPLLQGAGWDAFRAVVRTRRRLTHPQFFEDLVPAAALVQLPIAGEWFFHTTISLLNSLSGLPSPDHKPDERAVASFDGVANILDDFETPADFEQRVHRGRHSILLFGLLLRELREGLSDRSWAMDLCSRTLHRAGASFQAPQYASRMFVWAFFSELELKLGLIRRVLLEEASYGEITLTDSERDLLTKNRSPFMSRVADAADIFSRHLGHNLRVSRDSAAWRAINMAHAFRDRLTHPKSVDDLRVKPGTFQSLLDSCTWIADSLLPTIEIRVGVTPSS